MDAFFVWFAILRVRTLSFANFVFIVRRNMVLSNDYSNSMLAFVSTMVCRWNSIWHVLTLRNERVERANTSGKLPNPKNTGSCNDMHTQPLIQYNVLRKENSVLESLLISTQQI